MTEIGLAQYPRGQFTVKAGEFDIVTGVELDGQSFSEYAISLSKKSDIV